MRPDGNAQLMMPVAVRTPELERHANSLGWVTFDVDARAGFATGLAGLRVRMKQAYAENTVADVSNTAQNIAADIGNDVSNTADKVQNKVGDSDVNVDVNQDVKTENKSE